MNLIPIQQTTIGNETVPSVSARELHKYLQLRKDFSDWVKVQIERAGLKENVDFTKLPQKGELSKTGQTRIEYILTLDAAKHVAMMSQTERGREVRNYFISVEKQFREIERAYYASGGNKVAGGESEKIAEAVETLAQTMGTFLGTLTQAMETLAQNVERVAREAQNKDAAGDALFGKDASRARTAMELMRENRNCPLPYLKDLSPSQRLILNIVQQNKNSDGVCRLSYKSIAILAGIYDCSGEPNTSAVRKHISRLYQFGAIKNVGNKQRRKLIVNPKIKEAS